AYEGAALDRFYDHDYRIDADTNPAGCFAMLLPFCYIVGELVMCISLRACVGGKKNAEREREAERQRERELADVVEKVPQQTGGNEGVEGERETGTAVDVPADNEDDALSATLYPALEGLTHTMLVCIVALFILSILAGFLTYPADMAVTNKFRRMTVERGYTSEQAQAMVRDAGDIGELEWLVLNTPADNSFVDYFKGVVGSEVAAPIMCLFPYAVGGLVGTGVGMYLGLLHATVECPSLNASVRSKFKHLMLLPLIMWGVAGIWALASDSPGSFQGSQFLVLFGVTDHAESLIQHTGNYELFLCACQLPFVYLAIRWVDLNKTQGEKEAFAKKTVWIRRFGTYSLSCFVYDDLYFAVVQWLARLYIPSCGTPEGGLQECPTLGGFFHMLLLGTVTVFLVLYMFDITYGVLSLDYWLSVITGLGVCLITCFFWVYQRIHRLLGGGRGNVGGQKLRRVKPLFNNPFALRIPMNHIAVQVVPILSAHTDHDGEKGVLGDISTADHTTAADGNTTDSGTAV
ncbi:hypothetical protein KIPB_006571, partial [Kipferlia bialata]